MTYPGIRGVCMGMLLMSILGGAEPEERFLIGSLDGHPVLMLHEVETADADGWEVRSQLRVHLGLPGGGAVELDHVVITHETQAGELRRFSSVERHGDGPTVNVLGSFVDRAGERWLQIEAGDGSPLQSMTLPDGTLQAWGPRGQRQAIAQACQTESGVWSGALVHVQGGRPVILQERMRRMASAPGGGWILEVGDAAPFRQVTVDEHGALVRMELTVLGQVIAVCRASEPVALNGVLLQPQLIIHGRRPGRRSDQVLHVSPAASAGLSSGPFQDVDATGAVVVRAVAPVGVGSERAALPLLVSPSFGIEVGDPELRDWIDAAFVEPHRRQDARTIARYGEALVRARLGIDPQAAADHSAKEAWSARRGDCSEHARLLTVVLRHHQVPSEPVYGVVYDVHAGGWRAHAWVTYFDRAQERWCHADSALMGVPRSWYLAIAASDDDADDGWVRLARWLPLIRAEGIR